MTQTRRDNLKASNNVTHADNTSGDISAADGRTELDDLADSCVNLLDDQYPRFVVTTGTATAYTATVDHPAAYTEGVTISIKAHVANTGADPTINITPTGGSALGVKTIKDREGSSISAGDLALNQMYNLQYDGTDFRITSGYGGGASISGTPTTDEITLWSNSTTIKGSGVIFKTQNIGAWDMDTTAEVSVNFTGLDHTKVIADSVVILNDTSTNTNIVFSGSYTEDVNSTDTDIRTKWFYNSGNAQLRITRRGGGFFDGTAFNDGVMNRGTVTVMYTT